MGISGSGFGKLAVALMIGISSGTDAPSSRFSEETFVVGGVEASPGIGLIWTLCVFRLRRLPQCMIVVRPLKRPSHLTIGLLFLRVLHKHDRLMLLQPLWFTSVFAFIRSFCVLHTPMACVDAVGAVKQL